MTAAELLSSQGVSMQQASDWVQARLQNPGEIYNVCLEFGISSSMLAEIVQPFVPGVVASDVEAFFSSAGFNAQPLQMNTAQWLSNKGISMQQASDWVQARLQSPAEIYSVCLEFGINSRMLAEIVQPFVPGVAASDVEAFFSSAGFNALDLRNAGALEPIPMPSPAPLPAPSPMPAPLPGPAPEGGGFGGLLPPEFGALFSFVSLNDNTGVLSNASLREAGLGLSSAYWSAFDPGSFGGNADGIWSTDELGFSSLGNLPATAETLESLFYGTVIRLARSIDEQEANQLDAFVEANEAALEAGNSATIGSLIQQLSQAFSTPAAVPLVSDQELAAALPLLVQLVGAGSGDLFSGLLDFGL